jgi:hypothetical protein
MLNIIEVNITWIPEEYPLEDDGNNKKNINLMPRNFIKNTVSRKPTNDSFTKIVFYEKCTPTNIPEYG